MARPATAGGWIETLRRQATTSDAKMSNLSKTYGVADLGRMRGCKS